MIASTFARLFRASTLENPALSLQDPRTWDEVLATSASASGIKVNADVALRLAPVWQAVAIISGDVAMLPLNVYLRLGEDQRTIDRQHPAQFLLAEQPNSEVGPWEFWRRFMAHLLLWGNAYARIMRDRNGRPVELLNLLPDRTAPFRQSTGAIAYKTEVDGTLVPFSAADTLHVRGLAVNNEVGMDLVAKARDSWGLAIAAERFASKFFAQGAQAGGILEVPAAMTKPARERLEEGFAKRYTGEDNWFKTVILRDGAKFHSVTIDAEKSQLSEMREGQVRDVARFFNLPPFKLGIKDSVSYNSAEQGQLTYLTGCLNHYLHAVASEARVKLLSDNERRARTHFIEHNTSKLIETDAKAMNEVLEIQRRNEIISANEWRRKINLPDREDPDGDAYVNPNTKSAGTEPAAEPADDSPDGPDADRVAAAMRNLLANRLQLMARRIAMEARRHATSAGKWAGWIGSPWASAEDAFRADLAPVAEVITTCCGGEPRVLLDRLMLAFREHVAATFGAITHDQAASAAEKFETTCAAAVLSAAKEIDHAGTDQASGGPRAAA